MSDLGGRVHNRFRPKGDLAPDRAVHDCAFTACWGMRSILISVFVVLALAGVADAQVRTDAGRLPLRDWVDPNLGGSIVEGVATHDSLWLRGASKNVVRFDRRSGERSVAATDVLDVLPDGPHLWALVALNANESLVRDLWDTGLPARRVYFEGSPVALFATPNGPGVLTTTKALLPSGEHWDRRRLAALLEPGANVSALTANTLFVGYNKGEWGGGLRRVDTLTGTISIVKDPSSQTCSGRLDPECAPVVGIIPDTENAGCVLAGASLAHLSGRYGEVLRVCEDRITSVFSDQLPIVPNSIVNRPGQTWPFTSLVPTNDGWVAVGQNRFARARANAVTMNDIPALRSWAGLQISAPVDGVIFVEAACCWGSEASVQYQVVAIPVEP